MLEQISIYTENRRGAAREVFSTLAKANINVLCFVNSDSGEFGTMRIIVTTPAQALAELKQQGYLCKADSVLAVELEDCPGALAKFLLQMEEMYINIDYMYVGYMRESNTPVILVHCDEMEIVESTLQRNGYRTY